MTTVWLIAKYAVQIYIVIVACLVMVWIFEKGCEPAWAVFIPFYNLLVLMSIARMSKGWLVLLLVPALFWLFLAIALGMSFRKPWWFCAGLVLFPIGFLPLLAVDSSSCNGYDEGRVRPYIDLVDEYQERGLI